MAGAVTLADLGERLKVFGVILAGLVADTVFVGAWIWIHHLIDDLSHVLGELEGINRLLTTVLADTLDGATLVVVLSYVVRDVYLSVRRTWRSA